MLKEAVGAEGGIGGDAGAVEKLRHDGGGGQCDCGGVSREDLLQPNRMMLIWRVPKRYYEAMFPLTIEPALGNWCGVGMIFDGLDSQAGDGSSWLPAWPGG